MNIDYQFLIKVMAARKDVVEWLNNRPYTGLNVTDVATLVDGFDYLANLIKHLSGEDPTSSSDKQLESTGQSATIKITLGE